MSQIGKTKTIVCLSVCLSLKQRRMLSFHMDYQIIFLNLKMNLHQENGNKKSLCLCLYLCLSVCLCVSLCPSVFVSLSCVFMSLSVSLCLFLCLSLCLCLYVSVSLSVSVCLCLSVCLSQWMCGAHSPVGLLADGTSLIVITAC